MRKTMKAGRKANAVRRSMKGGYQLIQECWSFKTCKLILAALSKQYTFLSKYPEGIPPGVGTNWNECIRLLASIAEVSPEELFNRMTPDEFLTKIGEGMLLYTGGGAFKVGAKLSEAWQKEYEGWREAKRSGDRLTLQLPGKRMSAARKASATAWQQKEEEEEEEYQRGVGKEEWLATAKNSYLRNMVGHEEYNARVKALEDGASSVCSEENEDRWNDGANVGWCRAVRKGQAKKNARRAAEREAELWKGAYAALNASAAVQKPSSLVQGNLLGLNRKPNQKNNSTRKAVEKELGGLF